MRPFDLNLLIAFDALMAERNVTRAAQSIRIGQPAMSYALSRLRDLFGDELFTRVASKMEPTPRAIELARPIARIISDIRNSICVDSIFQPEVAEMSFYLGITDYAEAILLPAVLEALSQAAPNIKLVVSSIDSERLKRALESGITDLAIGYFPRTPDSILGEVLFHEDFECLFDPTACKVSAPLSLAAYVRLPHIVMSLCEELTSHIDDEIARKDLDRFSLVATPHFLAIPFLLHRFPAVAAVPRRLAKHCAAFGSLVSSPMPLRSRGFDVSMHWHARTQGNPAHRWFRQLVREASQSNNDGLPLKDRKH